MAKSGDTSGSVLYENGFSNVRLLVNGTRIGNAILAPSTSCLTFDNFNLRFGAGSRAELRLIADTEGGLKVSETQLKVLSIGARSATSNIPATLAGLNSESRQVFFGNNQAEIEIVNGGSFTPGNSDNNVGRFKITNNGVEDIRLDSMNIVTTSDGFSYSLGFSDLSIIESGRLARVGAISRPVAGANIISLGGDLVQPNQTLEFIVRVTADLTVPETGFNLYLTDVKAIGRKSGLKVIVSGDPTDKLPVNNTSLNNLAGGAQTVAVKLAWPTDSRTVNYAFHDPNYPFRNIAEHDGIDIDLAQGSPVKAAAAGVIVNLADNHNDQYNYVIIDHGNGIKTVYGHLSEIRVAMGQTVTSGQIIGLSGGQPGSIGSGPNTNGPHLHFGVGQNDSYVDPMGYLN